MVKKVREFKRWLLGLLRGRFVKEVIPFLLNLLSIRGIKARIVTWALVKVWDLIDDPLLDLITKKFGLDIKKVDDKIEIKKK